MKEKKEQRVHLMMEPSLRDQIDTYRFANRIGTRAEAIRSLVLAALPPETKTATE